jgi:hypothetical protein
LPVAGKRSVTVRTAMRRITALNNPNSSPSRSTMPSQAPTRFGNRSIASVVGRKSLQVNAVISCAPAVVPINMIARASKNFAFFIVILLLSLLN